MKDKMYYDVFTGHFTLSPEPFSIYERYVPVMRGRDVFVETWQTNIRDRMLRITYDPTTAERGKASHVRKLMAKENGVVLHSMLNVEVPANTYDMYKKYLEEAEDDESA